jgi:hypothetical protein
VLTQTETKQEFTPDKGGNDIGGTHSSEFLIEPPKQSVIDTPIYVYARLKWRDKWCILFNIGKKMQKKREKKTRISG